MGVMVRPAEVFVDSTGPPMYRRGGEQFEQTCGSIAGSRRARAPAAAH
jgi:hypothetical protein